MSLHDILRKRLTSPQKQPRDLSKGYDIESDFIYKGIRCLVVVSTSGFRCGYCRVERGHKLFGVECDNLAIEVHGGLTYSGSGCIKEMGTDDWWFGFDCAHAGDGIDLNMLNPEEVEICRKSVIFMNGTIKSTLYVEEECKRLVNWLHHHQYTIRSSIVNGGTISIYSSSSSSSSSSRSSSSRSK